MIRLLIIGLLVSLLSACSTARLLYNNADWLLEAKIDAYFDLDQGQADDLSRRLKQLHLWHRRHELPGYARLLVQLADKAKDGLSTAEIAATADQIEAARQSLAVGLIPELSVFLGALQADQVRHYDRAFGEEMETEQALAEGPFSERQQALAEELIDRLQHWTGPLDFTQREFINARFQGLPDYQPVWLAFRLQRHRELIQLLLAQPGHRLIQQRLEAWWQDRQATYPEDYRTSRQTSRDAFIALLSAVDQQLSPEQRRYLLDQLENYRKDFELLAAAEP